MLTRPLAQFEILQLGRPGSPDRHAQLARRILGPHLPRPRHHMLERNLDPHRITAAPADAVDKFDRQIRYGWRLKGNLNPGHWLALKQSLPIPQAETKGTFPEFIRNKVLRQGHPPVPMNQRVNAAPGTAGRDAHQSLGRHIAEIGGKIRNHEKMVFFSNHTSLLVVFRDRLVFVAQIHLDDFLHVLIEFSQFLLDLAALGPDPAVN